jgi:hypothetical protein
MPEASNTSAAPPHPPSETRRAALDRDVRAASVTRAFFVIALAGCGASSGYMHRDVIAMRTLPPVEAPLARELVTRFKYSVGSPPSQAPYDDAPASHRPSPLGILKNGVDTGPIATRPQHTFIVHRNVDLDRPLALDAATQARLPLGGVRFAPMSEQAYRRLTVEQAGAINSLDRASAAGNLLMAQVGGLMALAAEAERWVLLSDATLRRRMLLESGAVAPSAPEGTRLAFYYQFLLTGKGTLDERNQYIGCVAQLQQRQPDGTFVTVDGEGYGWHGIFWQREASSLPPPPAGYITPQEANLGFRLIEDKHDPRRFEIALWEYPYRACRVAVSRLAARRQKPPT